MQKKIIIDKCFDFSEKIMIVFWKLILNIKKYKTQFKNALLPKKDFLVYFSVPFLLMLVKRY